MLKRISLLFIILAIASSAHAGMARVTAIHDGRTIAVDRGGKTETLRLAGVEITDEVRARDLLRWTIGTSWGPARRSGGSASS